ncbi:uncharacterized protein [Physcomitrium patens]|uniref:Uncharacterized protein n=1 Tax=Physcomitrium patens TaxID=3218 RepID=A0A2K1KWJ8_PHYPA|nr:uncharacterized protein LOC112280643 [Physcomitrium patens]PNR58120.1 hypothetical protein PHYPA_005115 [Physcomitrium patens]|eukprot:XP_024372108.1 uncharacterized protein LOC112280643 [Physcomitrella patens]
MLQGMGLRLDRAGSFGSRSGAVKPLVHKHGFRVAVTASTKVRPKIMRLKQDEIGAVLPWTGSGEQRLQKLGTPSTWLARLAISLAGSVLFYNYNTMAAAMASLYWAWDPVLSTTFANTFLRLQYPYAGLWRARVLAVKVVKPARRPRSDDVFQEIFESQAPVKPFLKLVIGDGSSATLEMKVVMPSKKNQVQVGELVEVLVLSDIKSLSRFMAVRDVYLPDMDLWLSEDPCIERPLFEDLVQTLRAGSSSSSLVPPAVKGRDTQSVKARVPESIDMLPESSLDRREFDKDFLAPEPQTARRWRLTQLDYEEFEPVVEDDPKLQALRRLNRTQTEGEFPVRAQADTYDPPMKFTRIQDSNSYSQDFWEQDNSNTQSDSQPNQSQVSASDEDFAQKSVDTESDNVEEESKIQPLRRLIPKQRFGLQADGYGPPMEYVRMQEDGRETGGEETSEASSNEGNTSQIPDEDLKSMEDEQLTTVGEFLGSGFNEVQIRVPEVEVVQEEEV